MAENPLLRTFNLYMLQYKKKQYHHSSSSNSSISYSVISLRKAFALFGFQENESFSVSDQSDMTRQTNSEDQILMDPRPPFPACVSH